MVRWNLESAPTLCAVHLIVNPIEMIAEFLKKRAVVRVAATGWTRLFCPPNPLDLVVITMPTLRTRQ